jgi:CheY-like chemotaxis protein/DNA-binding MarR family transcriptional regulator
MTTATALIVDDDQEILDLLEERLLSMGHECRKALSQTEAEEILNEHVFDYILLDLEIPNRFQGRADIVYGHNLLRKIRQTPGHSRTPVLAITAHGLKSHHLCAETMKLGATDFVGKPFGRDNPLEDKIREALRTRPQGKNGANDLANGKVQKFAGGELVFYDDRVELCGRKICGAKGTSNKRRVLDILREANSKGGYRCFSMKDIADRLKIDRPGAVAEAVADLRKEYRERLLTESSISCEDEDVIANQNRGYHLRDWITVLDGLDDARKLADEKQIELNENQKGIIRLLRKHGKRTPRQLADGLHLLRNVVATEVDTLIAAGLVIPEGNAANKSFRLTEEHEFEFR